MVFLILLPVLGVEKNVIDEDECDAIKMLVEYSIHGIGQAEWHKGDLVVCESGSEGYLRDVILSNLELLVAEHQVDLENTHAPLSWLDRSSIRGNKYFFFMVVDEPSHVAIFLLHDRHERSAWRYARLDES